MSGFNQSGESFLYHKESYITPDNMLYNTYFRTSLFHDILSIIY